MKRLLALVLAVALLAFPVCAEPTPMSQFDYTDNVLEDGTLVYYFQDMALHLPADWQGKVMAEKGVSGVNFYQKASHEKYLEEGIHNGGFLFQLGACVNQSFTNFPSYKYLGFCESTAMNYYLMLPTDYPAYNEQTIRDEYDKMQSEIDYVVENVEFYENNSSENGNSSEDTGKSDADSSGRDEDAQEPVPGTTVTNTEDSTADRGGNTGKQSQTSSDSEEAPSWTPQQIRYAFEHNVLPKYFYDKPEQVLTVVADSSLYELWEVFSKENGVEAYTSADFAESWYTSDGVVMMQADLPEPDGSNLCYRVYCTYDPSTEDAAYYTVESDDFSPGTAFLCTWTKGREHSILDMEDVIDEKSSDYEKALKEEAEKIAKLAGMSGSLSAADPDSVIRLLVKEDSSGTAGTGAETVEAPENLAAVSCPEQGFTTMADKSYSWDYEDGTGISIYTETTGSIPYVIVYQGEDLIMEPLDYIKEQYSPYMQNKYGRDLVKCEEVEDYEIGGKKLPAGLYTYSLQGHLVEMIRIYDSTGKRTVAYTAKYLQGNGDKTLEALDNAVKYFKAEQ